MANLHVLSAYIILLYTISNHFVSAIPTKLTTPWKNTSLTSFTYKTLHPEITTKLFQDTTSIITASSDFGQLIHETPTAVFHPSTISDITHLVKSSYTASTPFKIAARGRGHSVGGQALAKDGVVVEMSSLANSGIRVSGSPDLGFYVDVGGENFWIDVLRTTMEYGLAPVSWTDYLYLTVGGTLSNAGISGQAFLHGPQISNVMDMDVITGTFILTHFKYIDTHTYVSSLLYCLGQFGIITRARIVLQKAPTRVKWVRMIYEDFVTFTNDQEHLISLNNGPDYVEGSLIMKKSPANNWRSSFFSIDDESKINLLASKHGIIYSLEVVKYYDESNIKTIDEELDNVFNGLSFESGYIFMKDVAFVDFLNRVRTEEMKLGSEGFWEINHHPWLNLFVSKSSILDFNQLVLVEIIKKESRSTGPFLVYPMNQKKWDYKMSAVIPDEDDEDIFYTVGLLHSARNVEDSKILDDQNKKILLLCDEIGIKIKQYLPQYYKTKEEWIKHFGIKWNEFEEKKAKYDPERILSPGQNIFFG
ncbi:cytokinin dehydrogenase 3-like [Bidens hawaiensis]|uniref:cytokinin dehydrogenase 3-like n=1 Tax=Bidens hawaiensis TaxID=980011 RepID=UPI00404A9471